MTKHEKNDHPKTGDVLTITIESVDGICSYKKAEVLDVNELHGKMYIDCATFTLVSVA